MLDFHMWANGFGIFVIVALIILAMSGVLHKDRTEEYRAQQAAAHAKQELIEKRAEIIKNDPRSPAEKITHWLFTRPVKP